MTQKIQSADLKDRLLPLKPKGFGIGGKIEGLAHHRLMPSAEWVLLVSVGLLISIGLMMILSTSMPYAISSGLESHHFFVRQVIHVAIGGSLAFIISKMPTRWFCQQTVLLWLWVGIIVLLALVWLTGKSVNGSSRWLSIGVLNIQPAEIAKMLTVMVFADFAVRRSAEVRNGGFRYFGRAFIVMIGAPILTFLQPDLGSTVILFGILFAILFISGAPWGHHITYMIAGATMVLIAIVFKDYRMSRVQGFLDPFSDLEEGGFQVARGLMAMFRGGFDGVGYGNSVIKLAHLPEAHTDFLLAITGEELGLIGVLLVLFLEVCVVAASFRIGYKLLLRRQIRLCYMATIFGLLFFVHTMINGGMVVALLPPKGLTMPFFSYGGSSMLVNLMMVGLILNFSKNSLKIQNEGQSRAF